MVERSIDSTVNLDGLIVALVDLVELWASPRSRAAAIESAHQGLAATEGRIVWHLGTRGPARPTEIARRIGVGPSSITKAVTKLRERGFTVEELDPSDGRATLLGLSKAGDQAFERLREVGANMICNVLSDWDTSDASLFATLVMRFTKDVQEKTTESGALPADPPPFSAP